MLPNLEFWISKFKENSNNLENKKFFDLDYKIIGDIHDQSKVLYPNDQSAIVCTKFLTGENFKLQYKVLKENLIFGIRSPQVDKSLQPEGIIYDKDASELWAIYGNGTRLLCEMQKKYIMRPKPEVVVKEVKKVEKPVEEEETLGKKDKKQAKKGKGKKAKVEEEEEAL